jgi:DNA-binding CsgD family transcriptional regulator
LRRGCSGASWPSWRWYGGNRIGRYRSPTGSWRLPSTPPVAPSPVWRSCAHGRQDEATAGFAAARALVDELAAEVPDEALRAGFLTDAAALFPAAPGPAARRLVEASPGGLTAREREVARLLTRGLSNREIAAALFVSEWTAATHIRNILAKLGLTSRTQIAAWAVEQGLVDRAKT